MRCIQNKIAVSLMRSHIRRNRRMVALAVTVINDAGALEWQPHQVLNSPGGKGRNRHNFIFALGCHALHQPSHPTAQWLQWVSLHNVNRWGRQRQGPQHHARRAVNDGDQIRLKFSIGRGAKSHIVG